MLGGDQKDIADEEGGNDHRITIEKPNNNAENGKGQEVGAQINQKRMSL